MPLHYYDILLHTYSVILMGPRTVQYAHTYLNVRIDLSVQGQKVRIFILITLNNFKKLRLLRILSLGMFLLNALSKMMQ